MGGVVDSIGSALGGAFESVASPVVDGVVAPVIEKVGPYLPAAIIASYAAPSMLGAESAIGGGAEGTGLVMGADAGASGVWVNGSFYPGATGASIGADAVGASIPAATSAGSGASSIAAINGQNAAFNSGNTLGSGLTYDASTGMWSNGPSTYANTFGSDAAFNDLNTLGKGGTPATLGTTGLTSAQVNNALKLMNLGSSLGSGSANTNPNNVGSPATAVGGQTSALPTVGLLSTPQQGMKGLFDYSPRQAGIYNSMMGA